MLLVVDVIDSNYSTTWELFSSGFPSSFLLFSQPLTKDTLPETLLNVLQSKTFRCKDLLRLHGQQNPEGKLELQQLIFLAGCRGSGRLSDSW
jgi:hypothetical protein